MLYDNDETGIKSAEKLIENHNFINLSISDLVPGSKFKDISEVMECKIKNDTEFLKFKDEFNSYIEEAYKNKNLPKFLTPEFEKELPIPIQEILVNYPDVKDKEMIFHAMVTAVGSTLFNVSAIYNNDEVRPNLFLFIAGRAGSGKGKVKKVEQILASVEKHFNEQETLNKQKQSKTPRSFVIPGNNTSAGLMENLFVNDGIGIIFETEADSISSSNKKEHGNYSEIFRNAYHNETIKLNRKKDAELVVVKNPFLSILLTGTINQIYSLIPNSEDGLLTRFTFYIYSKKFELSNIFDETYKNLDHKFENISSFNEKLYLQLRTFSNVIVEVPNDLQEYYQTKLKQITDQKILNYGEDISSLITRTSLGAFKFLMILTVIRKFSEDNEIVSKIFTQKKDIDCCLKILDYNLETAINVYKTYKKNGLGNLTYGSILDNLPNNFERKQLKVIADARGVSLKTIERLVEDLIHRNHVVKVANGKYRKVEFTT